MKTKIISTVIGIQGALLATAAAHPGPPGHVHGDEWPFGAMVTSVVAVLVVGVALRKVWMR